MDNSITVNRVLAADWLDNPTTTLTNAASSNCLNNPYYTWNPYVSPIRLKLSEIEHLRGVAKKDKQTREILAKFTGLIEIEVDFDG